MEQNIRIQLQLDCRKCFIWNFMLDVYIVTVKVHMIFYKASCLDVLRYMYFMKVWKCSYLCMAGL
jgi:hypothetical protein